tara:strand:- start:41 stop:247 length:207 start_codon:yes stop_codon:yes gene_type:complete
MTLGFPKYKVILTFARAEMASALAQSVPTVAPARRQARASSHRVGVTARCVPSSAAPETTSIAYFGVG